jgi:hypothetical protein
MKTLNLTLKKKWFDMILSGEKSEEYRDIKDYWAQRLLYSLKGIEWQVWQEMLEDMKNPFKHHSGPIGLMDYFGVEFKPFEVIHFVNGYGGHRPSFDIEIKGLEIKRGNEKWGVEKNKFYFVSILGNVLP